MNKLTNSEVADILHNMSAAELWQLNEDVEPIVFDYSKKDIHKVQKIYDLMDTFDSEYEDVAYLFDTLETPLKMAQYLTDNRRLQAHLTQFLAIEAEAERKIYDDQFWANILELPEQEQLDLKQAKAQITQRLLDRTGSVIHFLKEEFMAEPA